MRAIVCRSLDGPDALNLEDRPEPETGACGVRIRVRAAGLNFADSLMLRGRYQEKPPLPFTPGLELAGEIDALGAGVRGLRVGQRVMAVVNHGAFAEKAVARADDVVLLPYDIAVSAIDLGASDPVQIAQGTLSTDSDGDRRTTLMFAAGTSATLLAREGTYAQVRLRSGEVRKIHIDCRATIGEVSNEEHSLRQYGKAGAIRWKGIRPTVRGVAMNPVDHPHGGGEGRTGEGQVPVSPWNTLTKGYRTRNNKRTQTMIVSRRKK